MSLLRDLFCNLAHALPGTPHAVEEFESAVADLPASGHRALNVTLDSGQALPKWRAAVGRSGLRAIEPNRSTWRVTPGGLILAFDWVRVTVIRGGT